MRKSVILLVALALVLAVISIALILWPKQQSQPPNPTAEKRADKPYYPQLKFAISLLNLLQKEIHTKMCFIRRIVYIRHF